MDVAEALFADRGVDAVSVRSINAAAGLAPAAVHYHFANKDRLLAQVLSRRGDDVVRRHEELVATLEGRASAPTTVELVEVIARPYFELLDREPIGGRRWIVLVRALSQANHPALEQLGRPGGLNRRIGAQLARRYPQHSARFLDERWRLSILALMALVGTHESSTAHERSMMVQFTAHGFDGICDA